MSRPTQARLGAVSAVLLSLGLLASWAIGGEAPASHRLPPNVLPVLGCWFWTETEFRPGGYRDFLDKVAAHSDYNLLTTSIRAPLKEVADDDVRAQIAEATAYARKLGLGVAMDLDVRLARKAFQTAFPDELQEMLRIREFDLRDAGDVTAQIASSDLGDHYTFRTTHYIPLSGRLLRVYTYVRGPGGIEPGTVEDITAKGCKLVAATAREVRVAIPCSEATKGRKACVVAAFTHFTPDVFAPHLLEFQRAILRRYADCGLAGACKDEWGFPPCYDGCPARNDYWFSRFMAEEYARRAGGGDLIADCVLMWSAQPGRERERQAAINQYMRMCSQRNGAIEDDFYRAVKEILGASALVATHPTWYPYPGVQEIIKNGLDWWLATRDLAQTDEVTPYGCRTALAHKWGGPVWYNMYYATQLGAYERGIWSYVLGGGRMNFHPVYPAPEAKGRNWTWESLLRGNLTRGGCRIRLLNFISKSALDCPVAVVFGHACAMNWAGPAYTDTGMAVTDGLWRAGFPADLIPSSEIANGSLKLGEDGRVQYGTQRYAALILYHPEFEASETAAFFQKAAQGRTALYRVGGWTAGFDAKAFDGAGALPKEVAAMADGATCVTALIARLRELGVEPQAPAAERMSGFGYGMSVPPPKGRCRLTDGTAILVAGAKDVAGDPIQETFTVRGRQVTVDAIGVVAVRLAEDGRVDALAAGGLKRIEVGAFKIDLDSRADLAFWRDGQGKVHGVLQEWTGPVPAPLAALTEDWLRLAVPPPLP